MNLVLREINSISREMKRISGELDESIEDFAHIYRMDLMKGGYKW